MKGTFKVVAILLFTLTAAGIVMAQSDPFVGTWKLDVAKSKYDPGPAPKSQTRTWDASGKVTVEGVNAAGKSVTYGYPVMNDGKDYPTMGSVPNGADMISSKKMGPNKVQVHFKRGGQAAETTDFTVSNGGKTLTISAKGTNPDGSAFNNVTVWEKQ